MDLALLVVRFVVGAFFAGHGAQKLWGYFGGHGLDGTGQFFESIGIRPGRQNAQVAGTAEFLGGILLILGLLSPLAGLMLIAVMTTAILTVHGKNGPWVTEQGYEYNAVLIATAFLIAAGPGDWSLDSALGLGAVHGAGWALAALLIGAGAGFCAVVQGRREDRAPAAEEPATPADREERFGREPAPAPAEPAVSRTAPTAVLDDDVVRPPRDTR